MTDSEEFCGNQAEMAIQRLLFNRLDEARAEGLVPQGRQMLAFEAERLDDADIRRLLARYHRLGLVGDEELLLARAADYTRRGCDVVSGRLVMMSAPTLFDACQHVVNDREAAGPVPVLRHLDGGSPHHCVASIQAGLAVVRLTPLPGYFLRGLNGCRALTLTAVDDGGRVVGSSTVQDLGDVGPAYAGVLFSCALWVDPTLQHARLGGWLYAASLLAARDAFQGTALWSTVSATNESVVRMLARCHIFPDMRRTYIGITVPEAALAD